jgi:hypothetical protein
MALFLKAELATDISVIDGELVITQYSGDLDLPTETVTLSKSQFEMLILHSQSLLGEIGEGGG